MAGGLGFEPRLAESESAVLPLNYPPNAVLAERLGDTAGATEASAVHHLQDFDARTRHVDHLPRLSKARAACGCTEACRASLPAQRLPHSWLPELSPFFPVAACPATALPSSFRASAQGVPGAVTKSMTASSGLCRRAPRFPWRVLRGQCKGRHPKRNHTCGSGITLHCGSAGPPTTDVRVERGYASH